MIQAVLALLGLAGQSVGSYIEGKNEERKAKLEIKKIEAQGRIEAAKARAQIEAEYDNYAQIAMRYSWKDEYLVIILTLPFLLSFFTPYIAAIWGIDLTAQLAEAWTLVGQAPEWYQWSLLGIITATFGLRWASRWQNNKIIEKVKKDG
jgi:hypothetical protein